MTIKDQINPVYTAWFLWVDPVLTLIGMYINFFDQNLATQAFFTNYPPTEHIKSFVWQIGGMGTSYLVLMLLLLWHSNDIYTWKVVQAAILPADFTMLASLYNGMRIEDNLAIGSWRWEDWIKVDVLAGLNKVVSRYPR
ncbi:hypothetical protein F66182_8313 [Fusarium sp. NRRL 66182]|nr:hypothetical protein F66182_8313 [Fusarium sp. NRRL 66182]